MICHLKYITVYCMQLQKVGLNIYNEQKAWNVEFLYICFWSEKSQFKHAFVFLQVPTSVHSKRDIYTSAYYSK